MISVNGLVRVVRDIELRKTTSGMSVCSARVVYDRRNKDDGSNFIDCKFFGKQAEAVAKYFKKGSRIFISGRLESRQYTNQNQQEVTIWEIIADNFEFVDYKKKEDSGSDICDEDEIPF